MAKDESFDIVSEIDLQIVDDVINVARKELANRFDLKNTGSKIEFDRNEKEVTITAPSEYQLQQIRDILKQKMAKRNVSSKALRPKPIEKAGGDMVFEVNEVVCGIDSDLARAMVKEIKTLKLKVQASINEQKIRVSGKKRDDLQTVIAHIKEQHYPIPLQFDNFR
ncbi:MAG: YajQ family cyclic di-GMP-binding protein [Candidatus Omnitrophica bacterium]|nr:YajQ family cyclic di-GMP-binding protein [Candidatus Omnitrophota bacterium]